jgi:hypothetical protein
MKPGELTEIPFEGQPCVVHENHIDPLHRWVEWVRLKADKKRIPLLADAWIALQINHSFNNKTCVVCGPMLPEVKHNMNKHLYHYYNN